MSDEIKKDGEGEFRDIFKKMLDGRMLGACPNMTHLSNNEKQKVIQEVMAHALESLMKTYLSLGIKGTSILGAEEGFTKNKYKLTFKAMGPDEEDSDFGK